MRSILVWLFYLWLAGSITVLVRRRGKTGTFRPSSPASAVLGITADDVEPVAAPLVSGAQAGRTRPTESAPPGHRTESLAEALSGVAMPCDLVPFSTGDIDPRYIAFSTIGHSPADAGTALGEELSRLGFELTTVDDRTMHAVHGADEVNVKMLSAVLDSPGVMNERFPNIGADALVVELRLR